VQRLIALPEFTTISQADSAAFINITVTGLRWKPVCVGLQGNGSSPLSGLQLVPTGKEVFFTVKQDSKVKKILIDYCQRVSTDFDETKFRCECDGHLQITDELTLEQIKIKDGGKTSATGG
ncbi:Rad60-SLD domain-containing protein, partial [Cephalotus follicularis]